MSPMKSLQSKIRSAISLVVRFSQRHTGWTILLLGGLLIVSAVAPFFVVKAQQEREREVESSDLIRARSHWFFARRAFPLGFIPSGLRLRAIEQMREMQEHPVSNAEIVSAGKFLIGSFPLKLDRQSQIASFMLQIELYGLGLDYADRYPKLIQAVTTEDVQRVAKQYLHPDSLLLVAAANQSEAAINVGSLGAR